MPRPNPSAPMRPRAVEASALAAGSASVPLPSSSSEEAAGCSAAASPPTIASRRPSEHTFPQRSPARGPADPGPASDPANPGPGTGTTGSGTASAMGSNGSADIDEPPKGGSFGGYFLRKLGGAATSMVLVIVLGFFAFRMLPGDPVLKIAKERPMSPAQIAELRSQYGLDKPVIVQFWDYLVGIVTGDLGES